MSEEIRPIKYKTVLRAMANTDKKEGWIMLDFVAPPTLQVLVWPTSLTKHQVDEHDWHFTFKAVAENGDSYFVTVYDGVEGRRFKAQRHHKLKGTAKAEATPREEPAVRRAG